MGIAVVLVEDDMEIDGDEEDDEGRGKDSGVGETD